MDFSRYEICTGKFNNYNKNFFHVVYFCPKALVIIPEFKTLINESLTSIYINHLEVQDLLTAVSTILIISIEHADHEVAIAWINDTTIIWVKAIHEGLLVWWS